MNLKKFAKSFSYAFEGLKFGVMLDQNVRVHLVIGSIVSIISYLLNVTIFEFLFIIFSIFFVLIAELINTAIEEMTNLILKEHSREAKIAKDVAAGAVLLAAIFAAIVGIVILLPKILVLVSSL